MKNINKKKNNINPMAEAKKGKYFAKYSKESRERIRLGVEIYNVRKQRNMSQQELAKKAETTQKVISRIENGDVNIGYALLNRIGDILCFDYRNWEKIFNFTSPCLKINMNTTSYSTSSNFDLSKKREIFSVSKTKTVNKNF